MSDNSAIEWCNASWNPTTGCTKVSAGCDNCYAKTMHERFHGPGSFDTVTLHPDRLALPLRWRKPRRVFVNSMSDLFHDDVPVEFIARVFAVMALAPQHTFQVLTKRHARMRSLLSSDVFTSFVATRAYLIAMGEDEAVQGPPQRAGARVFQMDYGLRPRLSGVVPEVPWPLPNVWVGVSVEDQHWADIRIPVLFQTPAAVRWISAEPLLGPVNLAPFLPSIAASTASGRPVSANPRLSDYLDSFRAETNATGRRLGLAWVVAGGESGRKAKPAHPDWFRLLRDQCAAAEVPYLFKQWGGWCPVEPDEWQMRRESDWLIRPDGYHWPLKEPHGAGDEMRSTVTVRRVGKKAAGRLLDGELHDGYPEPQPAREASA